MALIIHLTFLTSLGSAVGSASVSLFIQQIGYVLDLEVRQLFAESPLTNFEERSIYEANVKIWSQIHNN
jgi:hypothetical protein